MIHVGSVEPFFYFHALCNWAAKGLAKLYVCADSSEP